MNPQSNNITPILTKRISWFELNGLGLTSILVGLILYILSSTFTFISMSILIAIGLMFIGLYNYVYNFKADFYDDHMTVEYRFGKRFKTINYKTIEKAEFASTAKSGTRLLVVYLDNHYGRHDIEFLGSDKELIEFVETKIKPIVKTNNFVWTPKDRNNVI